MSLGRRVLLAIVLALVLLLALVDPVVWVTDDSTAESSQPCMDIETRDYIRNLMIEGLDAAFRSHVMGLFDVWMKDGASEPVRAQRGLKAGVSAYSRSRASAMRWQPPCVL